MTTRPQLFSKSSFKGVFPHKGKRCAKLQKSVSLAPRWVPITGEFLLADVVSSSQTYLPLSVIDTDASPVNPKYVWLGLSSGEPMVDLHNMPGGILLKEDFSFQVHQGASSWWSTIDAGSKVFLLDPGCPALAASWWVVPPTM